MLLPMLTVEEDYEERPHVVDLTCSHQAQYHSGTLGCTHILCLATEEE